MKKIFILSFILLCFMQMTACDPNQHTDAKPVIYLYPETEIEVSVRLDFSGKLTCTYPAYNDGWKVLAKPDGGIVGKGERGEIFPYGGCAGRDDGNGIYMENRGDRPEDKRFCGFAAADFGGFVVGDHFGHGAAPVAVECDGEREAGFGFGVVVRL